MAVKVRYLKERANQLDFERMQSIEEHREHARIAAQRAEQLAYEAMAAAAKKHANLFREVRAIRGQLATNGYADFRVRFLDCRTDHVRSVVIAHNWFDKSKAAAFFWHLGQRSVYCGYSSCGYEFQFRTAAHFYNHVAGKLLPVFEADESNVNAAIDAWIADAIDFSPSAPVPTV